MYEPKKDFYSDMVESLYSETVQNLYGVEWAEFEVYYAQLKHAQEAMMQAEEKMQADLEAFYIELKQTMKKESELWQDAQLEMEKTALQTVHDEIQDWIAKSADKKAPAKDVHSDHGHYVVKPDSSVEPYKFPKGESWAYKQNYDNHPGSYGSIVPYDKSVTNDDDFADPYTWPTFKPKPAYDTPLAEGPHHAFENILGNLVPGLNEFKIECPSEDQGMCGMAYRMQPQKMRLTQVVMHLNDLHNWTREEIADWLETLDIDLTIRTVESNDISEGGEQS